MKTGIVVNNYDPTFKNRCQIRIQGLHTEKIDGVYVILDDDLPWALPAPQTSSFGGSSVPDVGSSVYVEDLGNFRYQYYSQVEVKGDIKKMMYEHADSSDKIKIIAYSNDSFEGENIELRIMYIPDDGLIIKCGGNEINMTTYNGMNIKTNTGAEIKIHTDNTIDINTDSVINLNCDKVNLTKDASERIILGSKLMEKFNAHTHLSAVGLTSPSNLKIEETDLSDKVRIN